MGLLNDLTKGLGGLVSGGSKNSGLLDTIGTLINDSQAGGLPGLIQTFKDKGLDDVVSSWISTGKNLPITADQIKSVIDKPQLKQYADKLGISTDAASRQLAEYLPKVIDQLTPDGSLPSSGELIDKGLSMLKGKLF